MTPPAPGGGSSAPGSRPVSGAVVLQPTCRPPASLLWPRGARRRRRGPCGRSRGDARANARLHPFLHIHLRRLRCQQVSLGQSPSLLVNPEPSRLSVCPRLPPWIRGAPLRVTALRPGRLRHSRVLPEPHRRLRPPARVQSSHRRRRRSRGGGREELRLPEARASVSGSRTVHVLHT